MNGKLNAVACTNMLEEYLLPFAVEYHSGVCVLQQNNALAHSARHTREFFMESEVMDLSWPPNAPDLNFIQNPR